ncbi:class I SAM-dependent methyltransferase [Tenacibaculum amylolyticum]|uniref:class I SAM-dependent methyltransferase n=1 Tax=Tenacibaculum amylolyticum TaxID=104269 RepID=UPI0038951358
MMDHSAVKKIYNNVKHVEGWLEKEAMLILNILNNVQAKNKINGNCFEIGVHHGKSSIFFSKLLNKNEQLDICDIFENQSANVSKSGHGNKTLFEKNFNTHGNNNLRNVHHCLSSNIAIDSLTKEYRLFHVDGGHHANEALEDLEIAKKMLVDGGLIIVDDPFREDWPGVTEAIVEFLNKNKEFTPIFCGFNKLIITQRTYSNLFLDVLRDEKVRKNNKFNKLFTKEEKLFCEDKMLVFKFKTMNWKRKLKYHLTH